MACAIGLSRILREDRATKDGEGIDTSCPDAERPPGFFVFTRVVREKPAFSSREAKKA